MEDSSASKQVDDAAGNKSPAGKRKNRPAGKTPRNIKKRPTVLEQEVIENDADVYQGASNLQQRSLDMTDEEAKEHYELCMKLSAQNKISNKNAFGLHLINLMQPICSKQDLQTASMSLQAGVKIFAGRIDCLYNETVSFYQHLQTMDGKTQDVASECDAEEDEENALDKMRREKKGMKKTYIVSNESVSMDLESLNKRSSAYPHGNFLKISSAFVSSRTAPRLLELCQPIDDHGELEFTQPVKLIRPKTSMQNEMIPFRFKKMEAMLRLAEMDPWDNELSKIIANCTDDISNEMPPETSEIQPGDSVLDVTSEPCSSADYDGHAEEEMLESVRKQVQGMHITSDQLVEEISTAITDHGLDESLLPENSFIRRALNTKAPESVQKKRQKKKAKKPRVLEKTKEAVKKLLVIRRRTIMPEKKMDKFVTKHEEQNELDTTYRSDEMKHLEKRHKYGLKRYFFKDGKIHKKRKTKTLEAAEGSSSCDELAGVLGMNSDSSSDESDGDKEFEMQMLMKDKSRDGTLQLLEEFQSLSIAEDPDLFPHDMGNMSMVTAELMKEMVPVHNAIRFSTIDFDDTPEDFNTQKVKAVLWSKIQLKVPESGDQEVLFSELYSILEDALGPTEKKGLNTSLAFVMLLMLANEHNIHLRNTPDLTDIHVSRHPEK